MLCVVLAGLAFLSDELHSTIFLVSNNLSRPETTFPFHSIGVLLHCNFGSTAPNHAFVANIGSISDSQLTSTSFVLTADTPRLSVRNSLDTEVDFDSGVLEISINSGAFTDILSVGELIPFHSKVYQHKISNRIDHRWNRCI